MALLLLAVFGGFSNFVHAAKFASVLKLIDKKYVGSSDFDAVTDAALSAAVTSLGDQWSYYMDSESYTEYQDYSANQYQGIGVTITKQDEGFLIVSLEKDGPAMNAGLEAGEVITAADGQSCGAMSSDDLKAVIQKDFGDQVVLTVQGKDGVRRQVRVSCEMVYSDPVQEQMLPGHTGYVVIKNFHTGSGDEVLQAIEEMIGQGAEQFIFDLRDNPGGLLSELITVLDRLLPEGELFAQTNKQGQSLVESSDAECLEMPIAVLVNADSYSAAEFFAAALQEYGWATIVGEETTGKSRSQVTYTLWDDSAVHLSTYSYLTPEGVDLYEQGGIVPDVEVALSESQAQDYATGWLEPEDDPQVQAALAALDAGRNG